MHIKSENVFLRNCVVLLLLALSPGVAAKAAAEDGVVAPSSAVLLLAIVDEAGAPIKGAAVTCDAQTLTSDARGHVSVRLTSTARSVNVYVRQLGYFTVRKQVPINAASTKPIAIALQKVQHSFPLDPAKGGTVKLDNGLTFSFQPGFTRTRGTVRFQISALAKTRPRGFESREASVKIGNTITRVPANTTYFTIQLIDAAGKNTSFLIEKFTIASGNSSSFAAANEEEDVFLDLEGPGEYEFGGLDTATYVVEIPPLPEE